MDEPPIVTSSPFSLGVSGTTNNKQWRDFEDLQLPRPRKSQPTTSLNFQLAEMPFILMPLLYASRRSKESNKNIYKENNTSGGGPEPK